MKLITQLLIIVLAILLTYPSTAQSTESTKTIKKTQVVMMKTETDSDGNVQIEKVIQEGDSDRVNVHVSKDGTTTVTVDGKVISETQMASIDVDAEIKEGFKKIKIIKTQGEGAPEIIEWVGNVDTEISEEMLKELEDLDIDIDFKNLKVPTEEQIKELEKDGIKIILVDDEDED